MYGRYGANGCLASYAGSSIYEDTEQAIYREGLVAGEYGMPLLAVVAWAAVAGTAAAGAGYVVSSQMAQAEVASHTGGSVTLSTGEVVSADELHERLCASGVMTAEECLRSPSEEAEFWADLPDGFVEGALDTFTGYDTRKEVTGECFPGSLDPRCVEEEPCSGAACIPKWVWFAGAAVIAGAIMLAPKKGA
jgi:hypothetical protein